MTSPRLKFIDCPNPGLKGTHRKAYYEWGDETNERVLMCVHGLTRNGRDFDYLAQALCDEYRVICPDVAGRGESEYLEDPEWYAYPTYAADISCLMHEANISYLDWVGTSMGGLIGLIVATSFPGLLGKLVLNDIGPKVPLKGWLGLIHISWLSPCGVRIDFQVLPPSEDL